MFLPTNIIFKWDSLVAQMVKNPPARRTPGSNTWVKKISWKRELGGGVPTPVFLPGEFHGQRNTVKTAWHFYTCKPLCLKNINLKGLICFCHISSPLLTRQFKGIFSVPWASAPLLSDFYQRKPLEGTRGITLGVGLEEAVPSTSLYV